MTLSVFGQFIDLMPVRISCRETHSYSKGPFNIRKRILDRKKKGHELFSCTKNGIMGFFKT